MYEVYISKRVLKSIRLLPIPERCGDEMQLHADDEMVDVFETAWYTNLKKQITQGMNLKIYRDNYGPAQNQLGQMLGGFSRRHISHLEHDLRPTPSDLAQKLSRLFDASIEKFTQ